MSDPVEDDATALIADSARHYAGEPIRRCVGVREFSAGRESAPLLSDDFPPLVLQFPQLRFMGSKYRLLPWVHNVASGLEFDSVLDAFSGSACVSYLFKAMGKEVVSNDFLNMGATIAKALIENAGHRLSPHSLQELLRPDSDHPRFIEHTFRGIFFTEDDLRFLDLVSWNVQRLESPYDRALALSALIRSCVKRQPRGVFTIAGDPERYKDERRDLKLTLREHFVEQVAVYNEASFDNGRTNQTRCGDIFEFKRDPVDLVYMDPPYVPRADDNCYIKRYHFLEGLSCYWEGLAIMHDTRVKKIAKRFTPFSYRRTATDAFEQLFRMFADSILVLSYSSNGYPDLPELCKLMKRYKRHVDVFDREHRYHFGTHKAVARARVREYLIVGYS